MIDMENFITSTEFYSRVKDGVCPFTDLGVIGHNSYRIDNADVYIYVVKYENDKLKVSIVHETIEEIPTNSFHIIGGLLLNGLIGSSIIASQNYEKGKVKAIDYKDLFGTADYPRNYKEKKENLLIELSRLSTYDGELLEMTSSLSDSKFWIKCYFFSLKELIFYIEALIKAELIAIYYNIYLIENNWGDFKIEYKGLEYLERLTQEGDKSNKAFVAMAFKPEMAQIRTSIIDTLTAKGYEPIIIDNTHIDSDQTINDAIIAAIRKCKFVVADFTHQRNGVYFEAGFAIGLGKRVIYTCKADDFGNTHFDTKHFQHIIYDDEAHLSKALGDKIDAWISVPVK